jgi:WD40 repeat protein
MPINSVDVQPKGFRVLTGGNDNKVCIWNLLPIVKREYEIKGFESSYSSKTKEDSAKNIKDPKNNEESKIEIEIDKDQVDVSTSNENYNL